MSNYIHLVALLPLLHIMVACSASVILYGLFSRGIMKCINLGRTTTPKAEEWNACPTTSIGERQSKNMEKYMENSTNIVLNISHIQHQQATVHNDKHQHHQCATLQHK